MKTLMRSETSIFPKEPPRSSFPDESPDGRWRCGGGSEDFVGESDFLPAIYKYTGEPRLQACEPRLTIISKPLATIRVWS